MTIAVQIVFSDEDNVHEFNREFEVMPRIGERIRISEEAALYAGVIESVEHKANPRNVVQPTIYVTAD